MHVWESKELVLGVSKELAVAGIERVETLRVASGTLEAVVC
jgi:hypothetical protein